MKQGFDHSFYRGLGLVTLATVLLMFATSLAWPAIKPHVFFSLILTFLFAFICIGLYLWGKRAVKSQNKYAFNNLISVSVFAKMALALVVLFAYRALAKPVHQGYILIFLATYGIFTCFEVWFMTRLAKS